MRLCSSCVFIWDRALTQPALSHIKGPDIYMRQAKSIWDAYAKQQNSRLGGPKRSQMSQSFQTRLRAPDLYETYMRRTQKIILSSNRSWCHPKVSSDKGCYSKLCNFASQFIWDKFVSYKNCAGLYETTPERTPSFFDNPSMKKNNLYETPARNETRSGWGSHDNSTNMCLLC